MKKTSILLVVVMISFSCVSKKKYLALAQEKGEITSELQKTKVEKEGLEAKFEKIQARVDQYNSKIESLKQENNSKLEVADNVAPISNDTKVSMRKTLENIDPAKLSTAKTLKDSMNLAVAYNIEKSINKGDLNEDTNIDVNIDGTVVMISIADNMLFNSGSYRLSSKADTVLKKLADVINSEPSLDIMVEGHTDSRTINTVNITDNWDLSVLRATSVVRKLQSKYNVDPAKLIASGRSSYQPVVENDSKSNRAKNRRTRIVILPNINKFFAMMSDEDPAITQNSVINLN